jgi:hypothetical protein
MNILFATLGFLVLAAVFCLAIFLRRQGTPIQSVSELAAHSKPVDLQAFRNLVDPGEEAYLRSTLSPADFRRLQRARMVAAIDYVRRTAHNAGLLLQLGDVARRASNPDIARAGGELANRALQLRLYSISALCIFALRIAIPWVPLQPSNIIASYDRVRDCMAGLTRMQAPGLASRADAAL